MKLSKVGKENVRVLVLVCAVFFMVSGVLAIFGEPKSSALMYLLFLKAGGIISCLLGYLLYRWSGGKDFIDHDTFRKLKG